jgi:hypothetical protein
MRHSSIAALITSAAALVALPAVASATPSASDPGIWRLKSATAISFTYWQGISSVTGSADPALLFTGIAEGAYRTNSKLKQTTGTGSEIPAAVKAAEGYNHIGDGSFDQSEGGRFLLPLECYYPGAGGNTCKTGAIGVADPKSLAWRYYVKLDPAAIAKAMWVEMSPDGKYAWTSSGDDLLAFRSSDISAKNAAPSGSPIKPARTLSGALKGLGGVTGAVFWRGKLLVAGQKGAEFQINSINTASGAVKLEAAQTLSGESEGLDIVPVAGGLLQWQIMPVSNTGPATYVQPTLMSFLPVKPVVLKLSARADGRKATIVTVTAGAGEPIPHAAVKLGSARAWSGRDGTARLNVATPKKRTTLSATLTGTRGGVLRLPR